MMNFSMRNKEKYENTFDNKNGEFHDKINSSALNECVFNEDTIREVLNMLMAHGLKIDYGNEICKEDL